MSCKFATTSIVSCTVFNDEWCRLCLWKDFQFFLSNVDMVFHLTYIYALCSWLAPSVLCNSMLPILSTCSVFSLVLFSQQSVITIPIPFSFYFMSGFYFSAKFISWSKQTYFCEKFGATELLMLQQGLENGRIHCLLF
jgi:hypothetical protein